MASSFSPSPAELALTAQIFAHADPQKLGALTGEVAVKVFGGANLAPTVLGEIWQIADESNNGWLSQKGVAMAVRLMGHAQKGEKVSAALLSKPGPLPTIAGITPVVAHGTGASRAKSPGPSLPPFTPQDKAKFQTMFLRSGPVDGLLSGEKAQEVFVKSKLPNETLGLIWNLADTQDRGRLDSTDFAIGMYLIQATMTGQLSSIPDALPPGFYQQVAGPAQSTIRAQATGGSYSPLASSFSINQQRSASNIQPQYTGASQHLLQQQATGPWSSKPAVPPHLPARPSAASPSALGSGAFGSAQAQWDVTPAEKANSDRWFDSLDAQKRGFIQDDVAVPFMLDSKLSGEDLAQIWDLADINNDGRLTRDGFAIAWYLIQKKRHGVPIPASLPPSLIPPSLRGASTASPFAAPPPEPAKDLFSWDEEPQPSPQPTAPASVFPMQQAVSPQHTAFSTPPRADPFGSSSFSAPAPAPAVHHDLLGDDDDTGASSPPIHDKSAEIGNVQNQVNSTSRSLSTAQADRQALEATVANQEAQLSELQTQLSTAKAAYETETKLLSALRERQSTQTTEINKTREELIRAESDLSAVRVEKSEIEGAFLRDKEEVRSLHRKMVEVSQQVDSVKGEVEKSKKEAKQQKGLLAIARKQLSTKEAERAKVEKESQEAHAEAAAVVSEKQEVESAIAVLEAQPMSTLSVAAAPAVTERSLSADSLTFAASHVLPATPDVGSPSVASSIKSNNPFDRLVGNSTPRSQSPFAPGPAALNGIATESVTDAPAPDPFGFARAFEADVPAAEAEAPTGIVKESESSTPKQTPELGTLSPSPATDESSDVFSTPLTANGPSFPAIDDVVATQFPPLESSDSNPPGHFEADTKPDDNTETDLGTQLKELDVQDSDSDSDSEDEVPLAALAKGKGKEVEVAEPETPVVKTNGDAQRAETTSFDDVFGVSNPPPQANTSEPIDAFGMPASNSPFGAPGNGFAPAAAQPQVAGVNAFDEALGTIPASTTTAPQQFSAFDSAFDDDFDFSSASGATETPFPPAPTAVNGNAVSPLPPSASKNEFDSIFANVGNDSTATPEAPKSNGSMVPAFGAAPEASQNGTAVPKSTLGGTSFDEAFAGFESNPEVKNLGGSLHSPTTATSPSGPSDAPVQPFPSVPSPTNASPPSQKASARSVSPTPRHRSPPPPRSTASPKGRPSTASSSKEEKAKDAPPPRHSKLSIRLPFGKKKKPAEPLPSAPSQLLTPPREEPERTNTPAVDDDVETVKQLTAMGFSRTQAVDALEIHGYDVQKALNSLLGAQ